MKSKTIISSICAVALIAGQSDAATLAFDDASGTAYNSGWNNGSNGGFGFGAWTILTDTAGGGAAGTFIATTGAPNSNQMHGIETSGEAWGTYANGSNFQSVAAFRSFTGGSLAVYQMFDFALENGSIQTGGTMGVTLRTGNTSGNANDYNAGARFELLFTGGTSNYFIVDGGGSFDTGIPFTNDGLDAHFKLTGADTYELEIYNHGTATTYNYSRTLGGTSGSGLDSFVFYNRDTELADVFFNSVAVTVPEPSRLMFLGFGLVGLIFRRRR